MSFSRKSVFSYLSDLLRPARKSVLSGKKNIKVTKEPTSMDLKNHPEEIIQDLISYFRETKPSVSEEEIRSSFQEILDKMED
ncbi:MAG: hypothetical protein AAF655_06765 [Bacteroidota bacterium]